MDYFFTHIWKYGFSYLLIFISGIFFHVQVMIAIIIPTISLKMIIPISLVMQRLRIFYLSS